MSENKLSEVTRGNTGPSHYSKNWCFTSFDINPPIYDEESMTYLCYGAEVCPTTKKRHWQCFVQFLKKKQLTAVKKIFGSKVHFETARGTIADNQRYCSKEGKYIEFGKPIKRGQRTDLEAATELAKAGKITEIPLTLLVRYHRGFEYIRSKFTVEKKRDYLQVYLFYGISGSGKSYAAHTLAEKINKDYYRKPNGIWFDGYDQQEVCVMDEFDETAARPAEILKWLDIYPLKVPIKGGFVAWNPKIIILTQVNRIEQWNVDRKDGRNYTAEFIRRITQIYIDRDHANTNKIIDTLYIKNIIYSYL